MSFPSNDKPTPHRQFHLWPSISQAETIHVQPPPFSHCPHPCTYLPRLVIGQRWEVCDKQSPPRPQPCSELGALRTWPDTVQNMRVVEKADVQASYFAPRLLIMKVVTVKGTRSGRIERIMSILWSSLQELPHSPVGGKGTVMWYILICDTLTDIWTCHLDYYTCIYKCTLLY